MTDMQPNTYQIVMMVALIFTAGISTGGLIWQVKRSTAREARDEEWRAIQERRVEALRSELHESRRENGVIIGCLYMLSAAIGNPAIKETIENMLKRESK